MKSELDALFGRSSDFDGLIEFLAFQESPRTNQGRKYQGERKRQRRAKVSVHFGIRAKEQSLISEKRFCGFVAGLAQLSNRLLRR
jgi:hypothetical protein